MSLGVRFPCVPRRLILIFATIVGLCIPGMPAEPIRLTDHEARDWDPDWSPDGTKVVFVSDRTGVDQIYVMDVSGEHLVQLTDLLAGTMHPCYSPDGMTIAFESEEGGSQDIWTIPAEGGAPTQITTWPNREESLGWSHGGSRICFDSNRGGTWNIWTVPATGGDATQVTDHSRADTGPDGSPDGSMIAFSSERSGQNQLWLIPSDGGTATPLTDDEGLHYGPAWSPDGQWIAYINDAGGNWDIWTISSNGGTPSQLTAVDSFDAYPSFSPDGTQIIFSSDRSGNQEIWIMDSGVASPASTASSVIPWVANRHGAWASQIAINNHASDTAEIALTAMRPTGETQTVDGLTISPHGQLVLNAGTTFSRLGSGSGYAVYIHANVDTLTAAVKVASTNTDSGDSPALGHAIPIDKAASSLVFQFMPYSSGGASAPVIVNLGDTQTGITLTAYGVSGDQLGLRIVSAHPFRPFADVMANLFPHIQEPCYLIATSDTHQPLAGMSFNFNTQREPSMINAESLPD